MGYYRNGKGCNKVVKNFFAIRSLEEEKAEDRRCIKIHQEKFTEELKSQRNKGYEKCLIDRDEDFDDLFLHNHIKNMAHEAFLQEMFGF